MTSRAELWKQVFEDERRIKERFEETVAALSQCRAYAANLQDQILELQEKLRNKDKEIEKLEGLLAQTDDEEERFSRY